MVTRSDCEIPKSRCNEDCGHCHAMSDTVQGPLRGARLGFSAMVAFLLPLALAITGGVICKQSTNVRLLGVLVGLALGISLAWCINRRIARKAYSPQGRPEINDIHSEEQI